MLRADRRAANADVRGVCGGPASVSAMAARSEAIRPASFSAAEVEISLTARFDVAVDACAHTAYD